MFAVLVYFANRWRRMLSFEFVRTIAIATLCTGVVGLTLKKVIEKIMEVVILGHRDIAPTGLAKAELESLFKYLPLMACALFAVGILIVYASRHEGSAKETEISPRKAALIGIVQGLCLPFRGFSRSGATISSGMILGIDRRLAEEFSFALAVVLTPPVIVQQLHRLKQATGTIHPASLTPGLWGMLFAFLAGLVALKWLSSWLENGKWRFFGYYCMGASLVVAGFAFLGY